MRELKPGESFVVSGVDSYNMGLTIQKIIGVYDLICGTGHMQKSIDDTSVRVWRIS